MVVSPHGSHRDGLYLYNGRSDVQGFFFSWIESCEAVKVSETNTGVLERHGNFIPTAQHKSISASGWNTHNMDLYQVPLSLIDANTVVTS